MGRAARIVGPGESGVIHHKVVREEGGSCRGGDGNPGQDKGCRVCWEPEGPDPHRRKRKIPRVPGLWWGGGVPPAMLEVPTALGSSWWGNLPRTWPDMPQGLPCPLCLQLLGLSALCDQTYWLASCRKIQTEGQPEWSPSEQRKEVEVGREPGQAWATALQGWLSRVKHAVF